MHGIANMVGRKRFVVHFLLSHSAEGHFIRALFHEVKNNRAFAVVRIAVAIWPAPIAPCIGRPAAKRSTHKSRITAAISALPISVSLARSVAPNGEMVVHKKFGSRGIINLLETLGTQFLFYIRADRQAQSFVIRPRIARNCLRATVIRNDVTRYHVARCFITFIFIFFLRAVWSPRPGSMFWDAH